MFLLILSTNPRDACNLLPQKIRFKQLIELSQLICSCGISNIYKPVKQGKELQEWILKNKYWVYMYYSRLFFCLKSLKFHRVKALHFHKKELRFTGMLN